jgi:hypothetical protein
VLGLTRACIADAKVKGIKPAGGPGFAYLRGPDDALVEYQGNMVAKRFNHVHMFHEQPFCAHRWYQKHLNVPVPARQTARTEAHPPHGVRDVSLFGYMNQHDSPALSTRGHLVDPHTTPCRGSLRAKEDDLVH